MNGYSLFQADVQLEGTRISNVPREVESQLAALHELFKGKKQIAIAVGSRGIANLSAVVKSTVKTLKKFGAEPFIIPAMGSHGGATGPGQKRLLATFGITETSIGCPIRSSMDVVELDSAGLEHPLYMDRHAAKADGVVLINRIKPHTDFHGPYESGLMKMAVIGLGKERQARETYRFGVRGLRELVPQAALKVLATSKVIAGIALVENGYDETALIDVIPAAQIPEREPCLLDLARNYLPRLPVDEIDVLIVDRLGKNISGCGMDTNVIGRIWIPGEKDPETPRIKSIVVTELAKESHGNATGMGLANVVTRSFFRQINFKTTYRNIVTSGFLERGKLPVVAAHAREALDHALRSCGVITPGKERIIRIKDTLHLSRILVSKEIADELRGKEKITVKTKPIPLFNDAGDLRPF